MRQSKERLIKEADKTFSILIRKRDADENGNVKCATCDFFAHWTRLTCGHFRKRRHMATRWDPNNALPQCEKCNCRDIDYQIEKSLRYRFGDHVVQRVIQSSNQDVNFTEEEIKEKIRQLIKLIPNG